VKISATGYFTKFEKAKHCIAWLFRSLINPVFFKDGVFLLRVVIESLAGIEKTNEFRHLFFKRRLRAFLDRHEYFD